MSNRVLIVIEATHQPPIDTPASVTTQFVAVESEELAELLRTSGLSSYRVIGALVDTEPK